MVNDSWRGRPTTSQLNVIERICFNLSVKFTGTTKVEARDFISANIDQSRMYEAVHGDKFTPWLEFKKQAGNLKTPAYEDFMDDLMM